MFQAGGEASNFDNYNPANLGRGSGLGTLFNVSPAVSSEFLTDANGTVFYIEKDADGNKIREEAVDLTLSPTRNPAEAYGKQKNREKLGTLQNLGLAATGVGGATRFFGPKVLNYLSKNVGSKLPSFFAREPVIEVGRFGTVREFAPKIVGLSDFGKGTLYTLGGAGAYGAIEAAKPKSVDFAGELTDLETEGKEKPDGKKDSQAEEKPGKVPVGIVPQTLVSKVISSPDFNRFLSNLSSSLTATGSIAQGGAQAASESFEEKLASVDDVVALETSDAERNRKVNELLSNQIDSFNRTETNIAKIDYVLSILDDDATGFRGLLGQAFDSVNAFFGNDIDKEFEGLSARERADKLLLALRQQDIRAILGESGRTISNLDREIVADIFGDITMFTPAPAIRRKLNDIRDQYADRLANNRNEITASVGYFKDAKMPSDVIQKNADNILRISNMKNFRNYMPPKYDPDKDRNMIEQSPGSITDVEYVEGT